MARFEVRAKTGALSSKEMSDTYGQLTRLMESKQGAVPKESRLLAAETFAYHLADPTNIDQGDHNTCNVTAIEERIVTRNPSKAAEIVATMAITGHWVAPDGKVLRIDAASLVPGSEERSNPPADGDRSYATQLLNLALVNDVVQRRMPAEYYSQTNGWFTGLFSTGEKLRYANGKDVTDTKGNTVDPPNVPSEALDRTAEQLEHDGKFLIANVASDNSEHLVHINSAVDLGHALHDLKRFGKLPAVILVDANSPRFEHADTSEAPGWHVVSITSYDEQRQTVRISNEWGKSNDVSMSVADLYSCTLAHTPTHWYTGLSNVLSNLF